MVSESGTSSTRPPSASTAQTGWQSGLRLRGVLSWLLGAATGAAGLVSLLALVRALSPASDLRTVGSVVIALGDLFFMLAAVSGVLFLVWLAGAVRNAEALGRVGDRFFSPTWAVIGWFIPIADLYIPVRCVQDLWRSSAAETRPGSEWRDGPASMLVHGWWAAMVASAGFFVFVESSPTYATYSRSSVGTYAWILAANALVWASAAALSILVVRRITDRQEFLLNRDGLIAGGAPPSWYDDPLGRFDQRYWDGSQWTDRVRHEGKLRKDPLTKDSDDSTS
jgi:hypothetical protein